MGVKVKFKILKLKLKLNLKSDETSVNTTSLFGTVRTGVASIVIYRVLQYIFKAIGILLFFGSVGPVY